MALDIVVVDSERSTRRHLELALAPSGYTVTGFSDGRSAQKELSHVAPGLVIAELLIPGVDGFELFQAIRAAHKDAVQVLCITGVTWGQLSLPEVLSKRFGAFFLRKPFLKSELIERVRELLGPGKQESAPHFANDWRIGVTEATRVESLAAEYETRLISVAGQFQRCHVRAEAHYGVQWRNAGGDAVTDWAKAEAQNISSGGLFIHTDRPPTLKDAVDISLEIPGLGRIIRTRARVAYMHTQEEALETGKHPGFGVEFVDLAEEDRQVIDIVVRELRAEELAARAAEAPGDAEGKAILERLWVVVMGVDTDDLLSRPGFLHRHDMEVLPVKDVQEAEAALGKVRPALALVHESTLGSDPRDALAKLADLMAGGNRTLVIGSTGLSAMIAQGLCGVVLRPDTSTEVLIDEMRERMGVPRRRGPRIPVRGDVKVAVLGQEISAIMVNVSTGGMLMRTSVEVANGSQVALSFGLPGAPGLSVGGQVVRCRQDHGTSEYFVGIVFQNVDQTTATALSQFVQSQVNFRDFFAWLKTSYFGGRLDK